jgi:small subunit ribosomal protein S20
MPNIKSAKKRAKQTEKRRLRNYSRKSDVKTAVKKVLDAVADKDVAQARELLREAQAKMARASSKRVFHASTISRKLSRVAKQVAALENQ